MTKRVIDFEKAFDREVDETRTFNNYLSNIDSNDIPCKLAKQFCTGVLNKLCFVGEIGTGKTHLLNATFMQLRKNFPEKTVLFSTFNNYQSEYVNSVKCDRGVDFNSYINSHEILIIDGCHGQINAEQTYKNLINQCNYFISSNKKVLLSIDIIDELDYGVPGISSILSKFRGVEMMLPNTGIRLQIISKILEDTLISTDLVGLIAGYVGKNFNHLFDLLNMLKCYSIETNKKLDEVTLRAILNGNLRYYPTDVKNLREM